MDIYEQAAEKIIREQEGIIGPLAFEQANQIPGLKINQVTHKVSIQGDKTKVLNQLVTKYRGLFGQTSVEVCKEAISGLLSQFPAQQVPSLLR